MRTIIRVVVEELSDEESLKLKKEIEKLMPKGKAGTVDIQITPGIGYLIPPPPPPAVPR